MKKRFRIEEEDKRLTDDCNARLEKLKQLRLDDVKLLDEVMATVKPHTPDGTTLPERVRWLVNRHQEMTVEWRSHQAEREVLRRDLFTAKEACQTLGAELNQLLTEPLETLAKRDREDVTGFLLKRGFIALSGAQEWERKFHEAQEQLQRLTLPPGAPSYQELREQVNRIGDLEQTGECPHHEVTGGRGCARCFNRVHLRTLRQLEEREAHYRNVGHENNALKGHLQVAEGAVKRLETYGQACLDALKVVTAQPRPTPAQTDLLPVIMRRVVAWTVKKLEDRGYLDVFAGNPSQLHRLLDDLYLAVEKEMEP